MARIKKIDRNKHEGKIIIGDGIVEGIVNISVSEMPFVELYLPTPKKIYSKGSINVSFEKEGVNVDVYVKIHYTQSISDMAFKIQEVVRHNVESMTEYHISGVNVIVKGVLFDDKTLPKENNQENIDTKQAFFEEKNEKEDNR